MTRSESVGGSVERFRRVDSTLTFGYPGLVPDPVIASAAKQTRNDRVGDNPNSPC